MKDFNDKAREKLLQKHATKAMYSARTDGKPTTPASLEELIRGFEARSYPEKFLSMYLGHVSVKIRGEYVF